MYVAVEVAFVSAHHQGCLEWIKDNDCPCRSTLLQPSKLKANRTKISLWWEEKNVEVSIGFCSLIEGNSFDWAFLHCYRGIWAKRTTVSNWLKEPFLRLAVAKSLEGKAADSCSLNKVATTEPWLPRLDLYLGKPRSRRSKRLSKRPAAAPWSVGQLWEESPPRLPLTPPPILHLPPAVVTPKTTEGNTNYDMQSC